MYTNKKTGSFRNCHRMSLQHNSHHAPSQLGFDDPILSYSYSIMMHHPTSSPSSYILAITEHSCCNMMHHPTSSYIIAITEHSCCKMIHHPTSSPSSYIIAITEQSCSNMMHHPTSSPSSNIMAIVCIHAATLSISLHHLCHPTLWPS